MNKSIFVIFLVFCIVFGFIIGMKYLDCSNLLPRQPIVEPIPEPKPKPEPELPKIIVYHNTTVIKKWEEDATWWSGVAWIEDTDYWIECEDGWKRVYYEDNYNDIQIGDRIIKWRIDEWFQPYHFEIYRNGTMIDSWTTNRE